MMMVMRYAHAKMSRVRRRWSRILWNGIHGVMLYATNTHSSICTAYICMLLLAILSITAFSVVL